MKYSPLFPTLSASSKSPMTVACSGCLLIAENADRKKPQVQVAQRYFSQSGSAVETVQNSEISNILLYKTNQGESRIEVIFNSETFWMPQKRMAELYGVEVNTVNYHLKEIFNSGELVEQSVIRKIGITAADRSCRTEVRISADLRQVSYHPA